MTTYIIRRLLWLIPVLLTVSAVTFVVMRSAPGGPWDTDAERRQVDAATAKSLAAYYGLDKPMWRQFYAYVIGDTNSQTKEWVCGVICGNLGPSYRQRGRTVQDILFAPPEGKTFWQSRFGYSIRLGVLALSMAIFIGIPLGIIAALRQNTLVDYTALFIATSGISVPSFVLAIFLIIIFASRLHWIDIVVDDWTQFKYWLMPMAVLGFGTLAFTARLTRSSMLEVMRQDYVRTARAKGLAERVVIFIHMLKNALIPVITILGPALAGLVTGSFIIETMFSFPGMGRAYVQAIGQRDYSMIMGTTLIYAMLVAVANLSVDIIYVFIDPRIRLGE
ncbi:MAG TPA: ABC transporter permease [Anaerolineales bacterium]|jgi:oligopeptide transport system permease protein|nr:ABC transporter permease [Anaerolineales bacterium]HQX15065.1 ABC transporter permease [Anaerolineales bacterium]